MPPEDRDCNHRISNTSKHNNHRTRRRKHFPLSTMPHCHRGKRKLHLDLDFEWDSTDTTPWVDGASDDYSSLESNPHLSEPSHVTFSGLRTLCEDFSFSLDSLNDNLVAHPSSPPLANVTTLHCPFASTSHDSLPSVNIRERSLNQTLSRVNLSDYESDIEEEESYGYEEEIPLIIESDCEGEEDSLQEFESCMKNPSAGFNLLPGTSPSDIPFKKVTSVSTVSASNSYDSIPTTSSNESLRTVSTSPTRSTSSELFPCPENYDMLYRNFEIAARMEESKNCIDEDNKDQNDTGSSILSSNSSSGSSTSKIGHENRTQFSTTRCQTTQPGNSVTTFALLADSRRKSPQGNREIISSSLQERSVTHWTEVLSKQCHSSKSSPESGINSPVDQSPDSPKAQRPHFLPLQLRHVQRPAAKPNKTPLPGQQLGIVDKVPNLLRTLSAPGNFENSSKSHLPTVSDIRNLAIFEPESKDVIPEVEESITPGNGDLISWTQTIKNPLRSFSVNEKCTPQAPLIDWEDIFTSRQSFCELDSSDVNRQCLPISSDRGDENANYSCYNRLERFTGRTEPKQVEDKGIMTSPPLLNMNCYCTTPLQNASTSVPVYTSSGTISKPSVYSLPPRSLEDFSDDSSLSSLESLEMDDSVFRESLYSLSSEHLYQSQTFTPVPDEIYEDSLCEDLPRKTYYDRELKEGAENQFDYINSVLPPCVVDGSPPSKECPTDNFREKVSLNQDKRSSSFESDSTVKQLTPSHGTLEENGQFQQFGMVHHVEATLAKDVPVRYLKHKPLKPIHQVDAEYRCRKALEQLTRPSHSYSAPSIYHNTRPQTIVISTNSTLGHPIVSSKVSQDGKACQDWQDDLLDSLPPQEMRVSPKSDERQSREMELYNEKRELVLALKSSIQLVLQHCARSKMNMSKHNDGSSAPDINQLVLTHICPAVEALVKDGMKSHSHGWVVGRVKNTPWIVIQATTQLGPGTRALNELYNAICVAGLQSNHSVRFRAFVMGLLNNNLLPDWLEHCYDHPNIIRKYYESCAFLNLCNSEPYTELFQELLVAVRHLSKFPFHLDYFYESRLLMVEAQRKHDIDAQGGQEMLDRNVKGVLSQLVSQRNGSQTDGNSSQEEEPRKLTSSVWSFVGKMKNYATQSSADQSRGVNEGRSGSPLSPGRGQGEGEPAENVKDSNFDQSILSDGSSETGWSISWIRGFANTVPSSKDNQDNTTGSPSQKPSAKTWGEVFKSARWQKFGSGLSQMVPKMKWKDTTTTSEAPSCETMPTPPLYERHISGCAGSPSPRESDKEGPKGAEMETYSRIRSQVKTRCHYVSLNQGELSFMKGDILTVKGQPSDEWLHCALGTESGLVHIDYIQEVD